MASVNLKDRTMNATKTATKNVTSFAHDAVQIASDLGSQAAEIGRNAADLGLDAASNVASAATHLAHSLSGKVPVVTIKRRRSRTPWLVAAVIATVVGAWALKAKRANKAADHSSSHSHEEAIAPKAAMAS